MQMLATEVWRAAPTLLNRDATVGELAWHYGRREARGGAEWRATLIRERGRLVGWAWYQPPEMIRVSSDRYELSDASLAWQVHPDRPDALEHLLDWFDQIAGDVPRTMHVREGDLESRTRLADRGYVRDLSKPWTVLNIRPLDEIAAPVPPDGYRLSTMKELDDVAARAAGHRSAWESTMSEEVYRDVMSTWPYRADLDVVVVAPGGAVASSALAWLDPGGEVGELEPVGTAPAHRRMGLARAASLHALAQLRDAGARHALVSCRGDPAYPIPAKLYEGIGFQRLSYDLVFRRS